MTASLPTLSDRAPYPITNNFPTTSATLSHPLLSRRAFTCRPTVFGLMPSRAAMSSYRFPSMTSSRTSTCRGVSFQSWAASATARSRKSAPFARVTRRGRAGASRPLGGYHRRESTAEARVTKARDRWPIREVLQGLGWACVIVAMVVLLPLVGGGSGQS